MDNQGSPHQTQPIPDADYCIVDTAGKLERELSQLFTDTDTLIVPTMSSPLGMKPLHTLVTHFRKVSPQARLIVVVNCYDSRRSVDRFYLDYIRKNIDPRPYTIPESTKMVQCLMKPCSVVSAFPGSRPPSKQLNIRIDETLHEKLSSYAYINRTSMRALIEGFIESLSM